MKYDAKNYSIEIFLPKFQKLLNDKYGNLKEHQRRNAFVKDYDDKFNTDTDKTIDNTVKQWFSYQQKPSIEKLMNICELLDCDIDYFLSSQENFKKEIANSSDITGLKYESIDFLNTISQSKSPLTKMTLQFLDLVLSSKDNFNDILTSLACIVFHLDDEESDQIASTYDNNTSEDSRCFLDETNLADFYLNYGGKYYSDSSRIQYFDNMLLLEINKGLERLKNQEKKYRNSYRGNLEVIILEEDYTNEESYIFENDQNFIHPKKDININITRQKTTC